MVEGPGLPPPISREEFLEQFGASDGAALGLELLSEAVKQRDGEDVEFALIVGFRFGFTTEHLPWLISLSFADWHRAHEDVVFALEQLRTPVAVEALAHAARWVPEYLEYDEARALASKAIFALTSIEGRAAEYALESLANDDSEIVAEIAKRRLDVRRDENAG